MARRRSWTDEQLAEAVADSLSIAEVCRKLGLVGVGGNYKTVQQRIEHLELDISHHLGKGANCGNHHRGGTAAKPLAEVMVKDSTFKTSHLKTRLLREGIFERKCYSCDGVEWLGNPIPLELEHVNGISNDHRQENLTILCPNCHALTPTYRGRNNGPLR